MLRASGPGGLSPRQQPGLPRQTRRRCTAERRGWPEPALLPGVRFRGAPAPWSPKANLMLGVRDQTPGGKTQGAGEHLRWERWCADRDGPFQTRESPCARARPGVSNGVKAGPTCGHRLGRRRPYLSTWASESPGQGRRRGFATTNCSARRE